MIPKILFVNLCLIIINMIVYFTPKKYDLNVIPTEANEVSEVPVRRPDGEESIELIKISQLPPGQPGLRSK